MVQTSWHSLSVSTSAEEAKQRFRDRHRRSLSKCSPEQFWSRAAPGSSDPILCCNGFLPNSAPVVILDKLTYAGNLNNLAEVSSNPRYRCVQGDVGDRRVVRDLLRSARPHAIVHFAAESHVDRSIHGPDEFIRTNVNGTFSLLEETRAYWSQLQEDQKTAFRFLHVSTDECYRSLETGRFAFL